MDKVRLVIDLPDHKLKIGDAGIVEKWFGKVAIVKFTGVSLVIEKHQIKESSR